ncbi:MAG TPA: hypothetical protein IAA52_01720 [Candidatus Pullichristensenella stercorigallinarum]|uniref:Uncharacterized protein n=1 Tax=Candidatus Pullichristensenella stercorigallinarum TaxID=2840909 RepID=A0A9D1CWS7_9FIRM|nr:hypothetical protein [Candidatus Pullichristensenella stercorigallinarum]
MGNIQPDIKFTGSGYLFGSIPVIILIAVAVVLVVWFIMKYTTFGRSIYTIDGNRDAAEVCGNLDIRHGGGYIRHWRFPGVRAYQRRYGGLWRKL